MSWLVKFCKEVKFDLIALGILEDPVNGQLCDQYVAV